MDNVNKISDTELELSIPRKRKIDEEYFEKIVITKEQLLKNKTEIEEMLEVFK